MITKMNVSLLLLFSICLVSKAGAFYTELAPEGKKCYMITTFPSENILIHIKLPAIQDKIIIQIECIVEGKLVFRKEIKKSDDKITVSLDNSVLPGGIQEAETCIKTTIISQQPQERNGIQNNRYLIWFTQHGNFLKHIQNSQKTKKQGATSREYLLRSISDKISNMNETYLQQLHRFNRNQENDKKNQILLSKLMAETSTFAIIQTLIIIVSSLAYCKILLKQL